MATIPTIKEMEDSVKKILDDLEVTDPEARESVRNFVDQMVVLGKQGLPYNKVWAEFEEKHPEIANAFMVGWTGITTKKQTHTKRTFTYKYDHG